MTPIAVAWRNPIGLTLLGLGAATAALGAISPEFGPLSRRPDIVLLIGLTAYVATVAIYAWPSREAREVRPLRRLRDAIMEQLAARRSQERATDPSPLAEVLAGAVSHLDDDLIPSVQLLVRRNAALRIALGRFERGELIAPEQVTLDRLTSIETRQREAVIAATQQAANAYGATLAMAHQSADDSRVLEEARRWSEQLRETQDALEQLLDASASWDRLLEERSAMSQAAAGVDLTPTKEVERASAPEPAKAHSAPSDREGIEQASLEAAWAAGRLMPLDQAVAYALAPAGSEPQPAAATTTAAKSERPAGPLTRREREVAALIAHGLTNRQIAEELVIAEGTVAIHVGNILGKLDCVSRAQVAAWAATHGLVDERAQRLG